ncbi:MAG TPA: general stress protein [Gemmatimonadales bacterium]|nr:general stress protein [Gemmatimonadales bacterium]
MRSSPTGTSDNEALSTGRTVVGLFSQPAHAERAIRELKESGFTADQIGVATHDRLERPDPPTLSDDESGAATVGALTGGVIGSLVGLLGSLLIPGVGPILVGGVLASLLGAGVGAAAGGVIGALVDVGIPETDAEHFDAGLRAGGTLVTVNAGGRTDQALAILRRHEADLGPSSGERRSTADAGYQGPERRLAGI